MLHELLPPHCRRPYDNPGTSTKITKFTNKSEAQRSSLEDDDQAHALKVSWLISSSWKCTMPQQSPWLRLP